MSVELRPLGVKCNIQCQYCYQNPIRDAGNILHSYDMDKMKAGVESIGGGFTLFGGEALLVPERDLEHLWKWGLEKYGSNGIQTNGVLINDNHVRMFKEYRVHVGISVDGPGELNDVRWAGSLERTREATSRTHANIERLCKDGISMSLIVTLHRCNATSDRLPLMFDWFRYLEGVGVRSARLHVLETEDEAIKEKFGLTAEENVAAFRAFATLEKSLKTLRLDVFEDMRRLMRAEDNSTTCIWNACDPYTTRAVQGIEGNGQTSNCGRTNKDGIDYTKASREGFERYMALYYTPQEHGGCAGCRFFLACKGNCPGTSIDHDWRNRTEHCEVWMTLLRQIEEDMLNEGTIPVSARPDRKRIEAGFMEAWAAGRNTSIQNVISAMRPPDAGHARIEDEHGDYHGDHTDEGDPLTGVYPVKD